MPTSVIDQGVDKQVRAEPNATERCDRCGAQAYVVAQKDDVDKLLLCGHHGRFHSPALVKQGYVVLDFSHLLDEVPTP